MKPSFSACLLSALTGCATSPAMRAAHEGDLAALRSAVDKREKVGNLDNGEAASLARVVADREVRAAVGPSAVERVHDVWPCAHELDGALAERAKGHDDAGAEAALARIDGRGLGVDDARAYLSDSDPRWRAVGTRGLVRPEDHSARLRALLDPDPHVRRQAARAARDATDPNELQPLAEVARVDPEPIVRSEAVRAIATLSPRPGGDAANAANAANALRDLWTVGDDGLREDIALAWAAPAVWNAGGSEALRIVVASGHGSGVVEAAAAVARHKDASGEVSGAALAQLTRAIEQGPRATRLQSIAQAPLGPPELLGAIRKAGEAEDEEIRVAALARLAEAKQPGVVEKLEALAQPGSAVALRARFALASIHDRRVQAWIEGDLAAEHPFDRLSAATALSALGVSARAAPLLADADPSVRVRAACTILMAARSR